MLRTTLSAITAIVIGTSGLSAEAVDKSISVSIDPDAGNKKSIIVVPTDTTVNQPQNSSGGVYTLEPTPEQVIQSAPSSSGFSDTIVYASGAKNSYKENEPIHIRLKLKRRAFIYFWTISANGNGYLILPNNLESYNDYKANTDYVVPERSADYDFVSDRAGVEQVYVLATNKKINQSKIESIFNERVGGVIPMATNKEIKSFVTKDIQVVARNQNLKYDIESFQIQVHPEHTPSTVNITVNH